MSIGPDTQGWLYFLTGMLFICLVSCSLLFLRQWRRTGDRIFGFFALAFLIFALNRFGNLFVSEPDETFTYLYLMRLSGFLIILYAIIEKNFLVKR
ncbi:DUF5985 family protein [Uliginosibacterium sp. H1]|uniref:DUF5985 family protein n=1 Tax=Uliginosibacterium sp. H1 TaxID=3114757 RepID=UPI002E18DF5A|nr:DUF5985 family protein [Uliginosibacterium sp. H1]